jgi:hypothetical protein
MDWLAPNAFAAVAPYTSFALAHQEWMPVNERRPTALKVRVH